jgi:hypothetical protein
MLDQKKTKNWNYIKTGIAFLIFSLIPMNLTVDSDDLVEKTITVYKPILHIKGSNSRYSYRIWTKEYKNSFVIRRAAAMADNNGILEKITTGDQLTIAIKRSDLDRLATTSYQISIYALTRNGQKVFTADSYNLAEKLLNYRWRIVGFLMGLLLTLRGMQYISSRVGYILAGVFIGIFLLLRICT